MKRLILSDGLNYGFDRSGKRICVGAKMGRRNILPANTYSPQKLRMRRVRMVDGGAYDEQGAYWGTGEPLYCAWNNDAMIFVRAKNRECAKKEVRHILLNAKFYR